MDFKAELAEARRVNVELQAQLQHAANPDRVDSRHELKQPIASLVQRMVINLFCLFPLARFFQSLSKGKTTNLGFSKFCSQVSAQENVCTSGLHSILVMCSYLVYAV